MSVVPRKVIRQRLIQTAVLDKIEHEHLPRDTDQVRHSVDRIREQVRGKSLLEHVERWDRRSGLRCRRGGSIRRQRSVGRRSRRGRRRSWRGQLPWRGRCRGRRGYDRPS